MKGSQLQLKTACMLVMLGVWSITAGAQGLINPSFETAGDSAERPAGWNHWGQWFNREDSWTPTHSGRCLLGYHHWQLEGADNSGLWQDVAGLTNGLTYTFGIYVSADKVKDSKKDAQTIELRLETTTADKQQAIVASKTYKVADLPADDWRELTVNGVPENGTLRVLVVVTPSPEEHNRGGALRFDDAYLNLSK